MSKCSTLSALSNKINNNKINNNNNIPEFKLNVIKKDNLFKKCKKNIRSMKVSSICYSRKKGSDSSIIRNYRYIQLFSYMEALKQSSDSDIICDLNIIYKFINRISLCDINFILIKSFDKYDKFECDFNLDFNKVDTNYYKFSSQSKEFQIIFDSNKIGEATNLTLIVNKGNNCIIREYNIKDLIFENDILILE